MNISTCISWNETWIDNTYSDMTQKLPLSSQQQYLWEEIGVILGPIPPLISPAETSNE